MKKYYYQIDKWFGPYTFQEIKDLKLDPLIPIWHPGVCRNGVPRPQNCTCSKSNIALLILENMNLVLVAPKGKGYFCSIHLMKDINDNDRLYAKKQLLKEHCGNEEYDHRLQREISILETLQECPNIINLIVAGYDEVKQTPWYLMPYADSNLYDYIKRGNSTILLEERIEIFRKIISAIKFAHNKGILHRDISPNNVLVFKKDHELLVKVSDFGLGKTKEVLSDITHSSTSGYGPILYVSPEQREKLKESDERSDIYSLGKLAYFVFTGKDPINFKSFKFNSLFRKATEENPNARHANIEDFESDFEQICNIILDKNSIPFEDLTLNDVIKSDKLDWSLFHQVAIRPDSAGNPCKNFIRPIIEVFSKHRVFQEYCRNVGLGITDFMQAFDKNMDICLKMHKWEFEELSDFGSLILMFYKNLTDDDDRLICIQWLWNIGYGYEFNRYSVQDDFRSALEILPSSLHHHLAEYIKVNYKEVDLSSFMDISVPQSIKLALIEGNKKANNDRLDSRNGLDLDW